MTCEHGLTTKECYVCSSPKYGEKKMTTLKTLEMALEAYEVPLVEQLERVPKDARLVIDDADGMGTRFIPVGRMCHEAATALRQQIALEKMAENARELGLNYYIPCCKDQTCPKCVAAKQPATWISLTDDEIWDVYKKVDSMQYLEFSRAIEAKLKSKNEHQ